MSFSVLLLSNMLCHIVFISYLVLLAVGIGLEKADSWENVTRCIISGIGRGWQQST